MMGNGELVAAVVTEYCNHESLLNGIMFVDTLSETQEDKSIYKAFSDRPDWVKLPEPFQRKKNHDVYVIKPQLLEEMERYGYAFAQNLITDVNVLIPESREANHSYEKWFCFQSESKADGARPTQLKGIDDCIVNSFIHSNVSKEQLFELQNSLIFRHVASEHFRQALLLLISDREITAEEQEKLVSTIQSYNLQDAFRGMVGV